MPKQFVLTAEVADGDFADITIKMNPDDVGGTTGNFNSRIGKT